MIAHIKALAFTVLNNRFLDDLLVLVSFTRTTCHYPVFVFQSGYLRLQSVQIL